MKNLKKTFLVLSVTAISFIGLVSFKVGKDDPKTMCMSGPTPKGVCVVSATGEACVTPIDASNIDCTTSFSIPL